MILYCCLALDVISVIWAFLLFWLASGDIFYGAFASFILGVAMIIAMALPAFMYVVGPISFLLMCAFTFTPDKNVICQERMAHHLAYYVRNDGKASSWANINKDQIDHTVIIDFRYFAKNESDYSDALVKTAYPEEYDEIRDQCVDGFCEWFKYHEWPKDGNPPPLPTPEYIISVMLDRHPGYKTQPQTSMQILEKVQKEAEQKAAEKPVETPAQAKRRQIDEQTHAQWEADRKALLSPAWQDYYKSQQEKYGDAADKPDGTILPANSQ